MPELRTFQTEGQEAQLTDILVEQSKNTGQESKGGREWTLDLLIQAAVNASKGINSVRDEGRLTLGNGSSFKISEAEVEASPLPESDPKWKPEREGAKLKVIRLKEKSLLFSALQKAAQLENAFSKKIGGPEMKHPCIESYVDSILNSALRDNTAAILAKELMEEKQATFSEKPKAEEEKKDEPVATS